MVTSALLDRTTDKRTDVWSRPSCIYTQIFSPKKTVFSTFSGSKKGIMQLFSGSPPSLILALLNIGILLHKKATLGKHFGPECTCINGRTHLLQV